MLIHKAYHLGFGTGISKANLARANKNRDWQIYQDFSYHPIADARKICIAENILNEEFTSPVYALDSTTIDFCFNVFWWATFRRAKSGIKVHTQYDIRTSIPVFVHITAVVYDVNAMDELTYEAGSFYIFDRAYTDFERLFAIHQANSFFVIRANSNLKLKRSYSTTVDKSTGVKCDQTGTLKGSYSLQEYPIKIRRIKLYDQGQNRYSFS